MDAAMKTFQVHLNSIDSVKQFVAVAERQSCEIDVCSGRYVVDGKSMLGLFSLDLSSPVNVRYYGEDAEAERFYTELAALLDVKKTEEEK